MIEEAAEVANEASPLGSVLRVGLAFLFVLANGFFVGSEFAIVSSRNSRITMLAEAGNKHAITLLRVKSTLDAYISATQLGITLASLALGWVGEAAIASLLEPLLATILSGLVAAAVAHTIAVVIAFVLLTYFHIVIGELVPKTLALEKTEAIALRVARPMEIFYRTFKAPIWIINKSGSFLMRAFGLSGTAEHAVAYTEDEIRFLIDASHKGGHLESGERDLIHQVFEFTEATARDCMVPRMEVVTIRADSSVANAAETFEATRFSRVPVSDPDIDTIVGILHYKDVISAAHKSESVTVRGLARTAMFVPPSARLDQVLARMQRTGNHMAIVINEHGGLEGLATLEDILEELVGEIRDEFDEDADEPIAKQPDGSYIIDAATSIRTLNRRLNLHVPESNRYTTLAGFLLSEAGHIPKQGQEIPFGDARFVIDNVRRNRVVTVRFYPGDAEKVAVPEEAGEGKIDG